MNEISPMVLFIFVSSIWKICCFLESWVDVHFTSVPSPLMVRALYEGIQVILGEFFLLESSLHLTLHICNPHFSLCNNKYICLFFHDSFSGTSRLLFRFLSCTRLHHRSLLLASRILKVHIETLTGFNHIYCSDSINTLLSHGFLLKNGSYRGNSG